MKSIFSASVLCVLAGYAIAQQPVIFFAHQEQVKPSMSAEYHDLLKKVKAEYQRVQAEISYSVFVQDDNSYMLFTPMKDLNLSAAIAKFSEVESRMGKDVLQNLQSEKGACIESSTDFITQLLPQYTYLAPGADENFRHLMYWIPMPGKEKEAHLIAKQWVDLHKSSNAPNGYQTFQTVLGGEQAWVVVTWGKDQIDCLLKARKTNEIFGEAAAKLWQETMKITQKIYYRNGWFMPELAYSRPAASPK